MINININNLHEGQVIKNYKELCELLEIKTTTGGARINQLKELNTYCNYTKEGYKYIINEIYKNPTITIDDILKTRNSKYIKLLANIILEYLYNNPTELTEIPISKLFVILGITNNNYNNANYYRKELSQIYDIRLASIYYFYGNTKTEFKNIIERCLNNLKNRRVLNWYKVIMIKDKETNQLYKADKETEKFIIDTEKEVLEYLNCKNMYELMKDRKMLKEFNKIVYTETNINYFYAYDLIIGENALKIEYGNVQEEKNKLNNIIIERTNKLFNKDKYKHFEDDYKALNDLLINIANSDNNLLDELQNKHEDNIKDMNKDIKKLNKNYKNEIDSIHNKYLDIFDI